MGSKPVLRSSEVSDPARPVAAPEPAQVQAQLERILASPTFATAKSSTRFLRYVVEETLAGRGDQIKEYVVGTAVFDRGDAFDPRMDAVVRVEATRLRNRLRDYYQREGLADAVSIELPKGSYVPLFQSLQTGVAAQMPRRHLPRKANVWIAAATALVLAVGATWWVRSRMGRPAQVRSIAVLPFENLSGDGSQDYLANGITERLTTELGHVRTLRVLSHSAVISYDHPTKLRSTIATDLKVDAWVEGSVARTGNRMFITERLLQSRTSRSLWSQSYTSDMAEIPARQSQSAHSIATAVGAEWPSTAKRQREEDILRINPEAYDYYLRGRFHSQHQTETDNETAIVDLQHAVAIDPSFASAYADLAQTYVWRFFLFAPEEKQWEEKAYVAAERALTLEPDLAVAHVARGRLLWTPANHFAHENAIREYRWALDSDPTLDEARNQLALIYCHLGFFDQALQEAKQAVLTNPNNNLAVYRIARTLAFRGQYQESLTVLHGIPEQVQPSLVGYQTAWALFNLGKKDEAAAKIAELLTHYPKDSGGLFNSVQAVLAASAGDERKMHAKIKLAIEKGKGFGHFHHTAYHIATAFALSHKPEEATKWLAAAADNGFPCYPLFATDHNLDNLRQNTAFIEFMEKLKHQWAAYKSLF